MKRIFLVIALILATSKSEASCWLFCSDDKNKPVDENPQRTLHIAATESAEQAEQIKLALEALQRQAAERFLEIETYLKEEKNELALKNAKSVLDSIRIKTGIDPKVRIQESIFVATDFPDNATEMNDFDEQTRYFVIRTISDFRGGLFMDLMNLAKRTRILYIRALKAEIKKSGNLTSADRRKIINDVLDATIVPMPIEDKHGQKIIVFDHQVANEDHTYLFNRELKMFLMQDPDLKLAEDEIDKMLAIKVGQQDVRKDFDLCIQQSNEQFYNQEVATSRQTCFHKYFASAKTFDVCIRWANTLFYNQEVATARRECLQKYSQLKK